MTTAFCMFIRPSPSVFWLLTVLTACITGNSKAQDSPVSFHVHGGLSVSNDVVYLQTTTLLNVPELYRLPPAAPQQSGIQMRTSQELGPDARIEVRVYDYDDINEKKGALIYAAAATQAGWNEQSWQGGNSLFKSGASFSEQLTENFNLGNIKTTDIRVLSQFATLGSVCGSTAAAPDVPTRYIQGALGGFSVPVVSAGGQQGVHVKRGPNGAIDSDEGDESTCSDDISDQSAEKIIAAEAARKVAEEAANNRRLAVQALERAQKIYNAATQDHRVAREVAAESRRTADIATAAANQLREAVANLNFEQVVERAEAFVERATVEFDSRKKKADSAAAVHEIKSAMREVASLRFREALAGVEAANARVAYLDAQFQQAHPELTTLYSALESARADARRANADASELASVARKTVQAYNSAMEDLARTKYNNPHDNAAIAAAAARVETLRNSTDSYRELRDAAIANLHRIKKKLIDAEKAYEEKKKELATERAVVGDAQTAARQQQIDADELRRQERYAITDEQVARAGALSAAARANHALDNLNVALRARDIVAENAENRELITNVLNENVALSDSAATAARATADADSVAAQDILDNRVTPAKKDFDNAVYAYAKGSADENDANKTYEDDDDEAGAAAAVVAVGEFAEHADFTPLNLVEALEFNGYAYLMDEENDDALFHNDLLSESGLESFQRNMQECLPSLSHHNWCELLSPMPAVLVEVAIKNAELQTIRIPGLPVLSADRFFPQEPVYDIDATARYVNVSSANAAIDIAGDLKIVEADYVEDVNPEGFSKCEQIKVPNITTSQEYRFNLDNWGRVAVVGTSARLYALRDQLTHWAISLGITAAELVAFSHTTHKYMKVQSQTGARRETSDPEMVTYEMWTITLNKEYADHFVTIVSEEGPFAVSNGPAPAASELPHNHEILLRTSQSDSSGYYQPERILEHEVDVFPNPAKGILNIRFNLQKPSAVTLRLYDTSGEIALEEETMVTARSQLKAIDLKECCREGLYILSIATATQHAFLRVQIE